VLLLLLLVLHVPQSEPFDHIRQVHIELDHASTHSSNNQGYYSTTQSEVQWLLPNIGRAIQILKQVHLNQPEMGSMSWRSFSGKACQRYAG